MILIVILNIVIIMKMRRKSLLKNRRLKRKIQGIKQIKQKMGYLEVQQCIFPSSAYLGLLMTALVVDVYAVICLNNFRKCGIQRLHWRK